MASSLRSRRCGLAARHGAQLIVDEYRHRAVVLQAWPCRCRDRAAAFSRHGAPHPPAPRHTRLLERSLRSSRSSIGRGRRDARHRALHVARRVARADADGCIASTNAGGSSRPLVHARHPLHVVVDRPRRRVIARADHQDREPGVVTQELRVASRARGDIASSGWFGTSASTAPTSISAATASPSEPVVVLRDARNRNRARRARNVSSLPGSATHPYRHSTSRRCADRSTRCRAMRSCSASSATESPRRDLGYARHRDRVVDDEQHIQLRTRGLAGSSLIST